MLEGVNVSTIFAHISDPSAQIHLVLAFWGVGFLRGLFHSDNLKVFRKILKGGIGL